jgi:hypothetical protein
MEDLRAAEIIKSLAAGSSPTNVPALQLPDVVRALCLAAESLEARARGARRNSSLPRNAGKTWTPEEDERLPAAFAGGTTVVALAAAHERTRAGIEARRVKHGQLQVEQAPAARIR